MPANKPHHEGVSHYDRGGIQPIDFMEGSFTPDEYRGYLKGNVIKYVSRYRYKGTPAEDLKKAQTYLAWLIEFEEKQPAPPDLAEGEPADLPGQVEYWRHQWSLAISRVGGLTTKLRKTQATREEK